MATSPDTTPGRPEAPKTTSGKKESGGRLKAISKRVSTRLKAMFTRKGRDAGDVLKTLSKEGKNVGMDTDLRGKGASEKLKKVSKRRLMGRELSKDARMWAKDHTKQVNAEYAKLKKERGLDKTADRTLSRKETKVLFNTYLEAVNTSRLAAGEKARKSVVDIQRSTAYKDRVSKALEAKFGAEGEGRQLKRSEVKGERRRILKEMYNEKYDKPATRTASESPASRASEPEPVRADVARPAPAPAPGEAPTAAASGPLPADASAGTPAAEARSAATFTSLPAEGPVATPAPAPGEAPTAAPSGSGTAGAETGTRPTTTEAAGTEVEKTQAQKAAENMANILSKYGLEATDPKIQELAAAIEANPDAESQILNRVNAIAGLIDDDVTRWRDKGIDLTQEQITDRTTAALTQVGIKMQEEIAAATAAAGGDATNANVQELTRRWNLWKVLLTALGISAVVALGTAAAVAVGTGKAVEFGQKAAA